MSAEARLAQSVECKALNLVAVGSSPTVGVVLHQLKQQSLGRAFFVLSKRMCRSMHLACGVSLPDQAWKTTSPFNAMHEFMGVGQRVYLKIQLPSYSHLNFQFLNRGGYKRGVVDWYILSNRSRRESY